MNITCYILRKNRTIRVLSVSPDRDHFDFNEGLYEIKPEFVNVSSRKGMIHSIPELYYLEDQPVPIGCEQGDTQRDSQSFLDEVVLKNAIKSLAGSPSRIFGIIESYLKQPTKVIVLVFALIILIAFLQGVIP